MKTKQLLFILLFAFACNDAPDNGTNTQVEPISNTTVEKSSAVIEDSAQLIPDDGVQALQIQIGQAGKIRKGMSVKELYTQFDSTQVQKSKDKQKGYTYTIYQGSSTPDMICTALNGEIIDEIILQGTAYKTGKGIGVGNTFAELTKAYHVAKVQADKNHRIYVQVEELQRKQGRGDHEEMAGILFEIGFDASDLLQENGIISAAAIPPDARIARIIL